MRESRADIIRWLHLHSRRYVAMAKRAHRVSNMPLQHAAETYAECLYRTALALAMKREITMPTEADPPATPPTPKEPGSRESEKP
jgi:hypothetical protein